MLMTIYLLDLLMNDNMKWFYRSDPTENDSVEGLRPNARGPGLVTFGVSDFYLLILTTVYYLFCLLVAFCLDNDINSINRYYIW
jgi:hypothetical protein